MSESFALKLHPSFHLFNTQYSFILLDYFVNVYRRFIYGVQCCENDPIRSLCCCSVTKSFLSLPPLCQVTSPHSPRAAIRFLVAVLSSKARTLSPTSISQPLTGETFRNTTYTCPCIPPGLPCRILGSHFCLALKKTPRHSTALPVSPMGFAFEFSTHKAQTNN